MIMTLKQRERNFKPRIKLNHNITRSSLSKTGTTGTGTQSKSDDLLTESNKRVKKGRDQTLGGVR